MSETCVERAQPNVNEPDGATIDDDAATPNGANDSDATNGATNDDAATNGQTNNTATNNATSNNDTNNQTNRAECVIDPFGNTCAEDGWEENDGYDPGTSSWDQTPWESNSWCDGATLSQPSRSLSGTLCAGDRGDAFRLVVANNGPVCITGATVLFRILVELKTPCEPDLVRVEPYTFGRDPIRNDLCADDADVRCTVSNGGQTRLIEWMWPVEQIMDPRVQIMAEGNNVQVDYDLTFEIVPQ